MQLAVSRGTQSRQTIDTYLALGKAREMDPQRPDVLLIGVRAALADGERTAADNYGRLLMRDFPSSPQASAAAQLLRGAK